MTEERKDLLDRIMRNARVLGRMSRTVDQCDYQPWSIGPDEELTIRRFYEIRHEQEELVKQLKQL